MSAVNTFNANQAKRFGWKPDWFVPGHKAYDEKLADAITKFQSSRGLETDGMCGAATFRVIKTERDSTSSAQSVSWATNDSDVIWWGDQAIKVKWPSNKVHTFKDAGFPYPVSKGLTKNSVKRDIRSFVTHWDVCLNSMSCAKVLADRNISVHFCIDNDGTIIQLHDLNDTCWHAGNSVVNKHSVGVEIANGFYLKYQSWYVKNGFGERPIMSGALAQNRKMEDFTWFYPAQLDALRALYSAIHEGCGVPLASPKTKWAYDSSAASGNFKGFMNHFHCSNKKTDCAGLDIEEILKRIT